MKRIIEDVCVLLLLASIGLLGLGLVGSALIPLLPLPHAEAVGLIANRLAFAAERGVCLFGVPAWVWQSLRTRNLGKYQLRPLDWRKAVLE